jgi:ABC-type multidrug transport system ATPase subunit
MARPYRFVDEAAKRGCYRRGVPERRIEDPVLLASELRVDADGAPACEGVSFRSSGSRILVLGAPRALFAAATGLTPPSRGKLEIRGVPSEDAVGHGLVAGAPLDPPLPPKWSVLDYVQWSARLSGAPAVEAKATARNAIARLKLEAIARAPFATINVPHARRAAVIAGALAASTEVVALEDPLAGLPEDAVSTFGAILVEALADRAWIVFAPRIALASPLARAADEAIVVSATRLEGQGPPAELAASNTARFVARLDGEVERVRTALAERGGSLEQQGAHVLIDLMGTSTSELAQICAAADVAILELMPVSKPIQRAFL